MGDKRRQNGLRNERKTRLNYFPSLKPTRNNEISIVSRNKENFFVAVFVHF